MISFPVSAQAGLLWWQQYQSRVRGLLVVLLIAYLLYFLADVIWRLIPAPAINVTQLPVTIKPATTNAPAKLDVAQLQALHLFGKEKEVTVVEQVPVATDAPETSLNLTLTGVVSSSDIENGAAIILHQGAQVTYGIGEKIEGTNATLRQVLADRVIIRNGVRDETLMLDGVDFKSPGRPSTQQNTRTASTTASRKPNAAAPKKVSAEAAAASEALRAQPENFTDYIAISPLNQDGSLIGYQVKPGRDPALFEAAGLKNGDIVVQINGMDLTDPQQAMDAMSEMRSAQSIELTVMRDGSYASIYLDMPSPGEVE